MHAPRASPIFSAGAWVSYRDIISSRLPGHGCSDSDKLLESALETRYTADAGRLARYSRCSTCNNVSCSGCWREKSPHLDKGNDEVRFRLSGRSAKHTCLQFPISIGKSSSHQLGHHCYRLEATYLQSLASTSCAGGIQHDAGLIVITAGR